MPKTLKNKDIIDLDKTKYGTYVIPKMKLTLNSYSNKERLVLNYVLFKFDHFNCFEWINYLENETWWKNIKPKQTIFIKLY